MSDHRPPDLPPNPDFETARNLDGPLSAQLAAFEAMFRERLPAAGTAYQNLVERLTQSDVGRNAPAAGDAFPPFQLPDENGRLISSAELLAGGPMVVSFNRGNWCPFCWLELSALEDCLPAIIEGGGSVVSITPEIATFSRRLKRRLGLTFPVLSDLDNSYALSLGLAMALSDEVRANYVRAGIDLGLFQRSECWFLPLPATIVVDRRGVVRHAYVNADFRQRFEPGRIPEILSRL